MESVSADGFWLMVVCLGTVIFILVIALWVNSRADKKNGRGSTSNTNHQSYHDNEMLRSQQELVRIERERLNLQTSEYLGSAPKDKK